VFGTKFGKVKEITLNSGAEANQRVCVTINADHELLLHDGENGKGKYRFLIRDRTLLGGKVVEVDVGTAGPPAVDPLYGTVLPEPLRAFQLMVEDNRPYITSFISNLSDLAGYVAQGKGSLGRFLKEEELYDGAKRFVARAAQIADALGPESNGSLAKAIHTPELHDSIASLVASGNRIARGIENGEGTLGALVSDVELKRSFKSAVASVEAIAGRLERGEGALGRLTKDESAPLVERLNSLLGDLSQMAAEVNQGKGTLGRLIKDDQLGNKVASIVDRAEKAVADIAFFTEHVRQGGGTLGLLLFDEVTRERLVAVVDQLSGVIEDAREAAPVLSVASFLFGTF
jgi:hypothetical protein